MNQTREPSPGSGIARALAIARCRQIRRLAYRLRLVIPAEPDQRIAGRVRIDLELCGGAAWPVIDFAPGREADDSTSRISSLTVDGTEMAFESIDGHVRITAPTMPSSRHAIEIAFDVSQRNFKRRGELIYTLFVPANAHHAFPCFDQPDLKAPLTLELTIPAGWDAVANAPEVERLSVPDGEWLRFAETAPLPSYLYAFAAGRFDRQEARVDGRRFAMFHQSADADAVARNRDDVFRLHADALEFLEEYTAIPLPFASFAFVLVADFEFSGMEHPGCIFYREDLLMLEATATESERMRRVNLIGHETAHLWFGDLVTIPWFDDVWLKEVFANFMADKIIERLFPVIDHDLAFLLRHYPPAYAIDRTEGTHAIRQTLENLRDAAELYDSLIYHKAPIAMAQLEAEIGEDAMCSGLRSWLKDHSFGNAGWPELRVRLERAAGADLADWSRRWIDSPGRRRLGRPGSPDRLPEYGVSKPGGAERSRLLRRLESSGHELGRAGAWITLYEDMLDGGIDPAALLTSAVVAFEREPGNLLVSRMIDDLREIYWRYLTVPQREFAAGPVERMLRLKLVDAGGRDAGGDARALWIDTLSRFATTPNAVTELEVLWQAEDADNGRLPESLASKLAVRLALRNPDRAGEILERQCRVTADPNRLKKLEFLAPALASERSTRDALFYRLISGAAESTWSVSAVRLLNHPLRSDAAIDYLGPGIDFAATLRRHGDIFVPRRWLQALFNGHGTAAAAARIRSRLDTTDFAPRLRSLILETADPVFRAAAIRARQAPR